MDTKAALLWLLHIPTWSWLQFSSSSLPRALGISAAVYIVCAVVRTLAHPLRSFPGPKLAKWTMMYRMYWDIVEDGGWVDHLTDLHARYGHVVRVGPNELHFSDPTAYADIYSAGSKFTKDPFVYKAFVPARSLFAATDPHAAATSKVILSPFFSRRATLQLEPVIQENVDKLISQLLLHHHRESSPADLFLAFRSTTLDIISSYCFARSTDALSAVDFKHPTLLSMDSSTSLIWTFKHFPLIKYCVTHVPKWLASRLGPDSRAMVRERRKLADQVDGILENPGSLDHVEHETVFHAYFGERKVNTGRKIVFPPVTKAWLLDEGSSLRFAGSNTVGNTCALGAKWLLSNTSVLERLVKELEDAWPDKEAHVGVEVLEKLPYLTAVIKESLRLSHGVVSPLQRVTGITTAMIAGTAVPPQTVVSIGATFVHLNPEIFPEPTKFSPDRWLQPDSKNLDKYLVAFSKGPRTCIGITLAWSELYLIFGNVFRRLIFLPEEFDGDVISFRDFFAPLYRYKPLKARVIERA